MNRLPNRHQSRDVQAGFTIIELLIATTVLSVILVMVTVMMVGIGRLYYKGINQARIQDNVRSITDKIAQTIKLTTSAEPMHDSNTADDNIGPGHYYVHAVCIGTTRYSYILNEQLGTGTPPPGPPRSVHVLWRDTIPAAGGSCDAAGSTLGVPAAGTDGTELLAPNSRLTAFAVQCAGSRCTITVGIAYGDNDLLPSVLPYSIDTHCVGGTGQQFCATAYLKTTVMRRLSTP